MTTSAAGANENALPKIDHFYPSDVHFYFKPSDTMPSITPSFSDVSSPRENTDTMQRKCDSVLLLLVRTSMVRLPLISSQSSI